MSVDSRSTIALISAQDLGIDVESRVLVDALAFEVRSGETWCVLGPNGSGKSTLLHVLAGLRIPQRGSVQLAERPYRAHRLRDAARIRALLLQQQSDAFAASVLETVMIGRHPHVAAFGFANAQDQACADEAMRRMGVDALRTRDVRTLSGGERQRVALATVLTQDPRLYLLDEPTAHLDLAHQVALFRTLADLTQTGRAVIFATHDYNLAARFATHALLLTGSGAVHAGDARELLDATRLSAIFGFPLAYVSERTASAFAPQW